MISKYLMVLLFLIYAAVGRPISSSEISNITEDPIEISKKIISDDPQPWSSVEYEAMLSKYGPKKVLTPIDKNYLLLQSPWLGTEYLQGVFGEGENSIPVEQLLDLLNLATNSPQQTSRKLAEVTLQQALGEYEKAYEFAGALSAKAAVTHEEAIVFLQSRFGYLKLKTAISLLEESSSADNAVIDKKTSKRISDRYRSIRKQYSDEIPLGSALDEIKAFYTLLEEVVLGLAMVKPYTNFTQTITELNEVQLQERKHWRSGLEITYPTNGSVWTIPDDVSIEWTTQNLPEEKTIKFYLLKNNTVIQELGVFNNSKIANGIKLNKTLPPGTNYRIMGIELFPADKYHTAKFASPYFSINKRTTTTPAAEEAVKAEEKTVVAQEPDMEEPEISEVIPDLPLAAENRTEIQEIQFDAPEVTEIAEEITEATAEPEKREKRTDFDGRNITYVQELEVSSSIISISLWDHGREDGDIVSIYLNGYAIVSKHNLTYQKKSFELELDPSQPNDLFLYAHNLGKFPPNTVSIEIKDGENAENIVLNSDLSRCEAVLINVKK
jgi:hypothetical protein